jgi:hypothetical protein
MMPPVYIDATSLMNTFNIPKEDITQFVGNIVSQVADEFKYAWDQEASVLKSSRQEYKAGLGVEKIDDMSYAVVLKGWLPNGIEQGLEGFDEKMGFKSSSKAHQTKNGGWYLTIPFRHASAGAIGESEVFSGVMPKPVYKEAKKLDLGETLDLKKLPNEFQIPSIRPQVITKSKTFEAYQHKSSIYAGMIRKQDVSGRGTYTTFRRVSENSDANSWVNSGIEARNFAEKAYEKFEGEMLSTIDALAEQYIEQLI